MVHHSQVEEKYGGTAQDLTEYWPPKKISDEYGYDPTNITEIEPSQGKFQFTKYFILLKIILMNLNSQKY